MLVRSPKLQACPKTIDLIFHGARYIQLPRFLKNVEIHSAGREEARALEARLDHPVHLREVHILEAQGRRHLVVAEQFEIRVTDFEMMESPWEDRRPEDRPAAQSSAGDFALWEYWVSHGSLLIRNPGRPRSVKNRDLIFKAVEFVGIPVALPGLKLVESTESEARELSAMLGKDVPRASVRIFELADGRRFPLVAPILIERESETDESPFLSYPWVEHRLAREAARHG